MLDGSSNKPTIIDFFAGAGGLSLGASRAGFNVVGAIELDNRAIDTHIRNFPDTKHYNLDLSTISPRKLRELIEIKPKQITGIIGGPPCQGFSSMGHRNENDIRNNLFVGFFDFINEFRPAFFIAENVLGILDEKFTSIRETALKKVAGYTILPPQIIKASEYGAPTIRTRVFFIGYDPKRVSNLYSKDFVHAQSPVSEQVHVRDALLGLPANVASLANGLGMILEKDIKAKSKNNNLIDFYENVLGSIPDHVGNPEIIENYSKKNVVTGCFPTKHTDEVINRYANLKYGQQDIISKSIRLDPLGFCPTLRAGTGPERGSFQAVRPIHYDMPRVITPREAARLQGFPDWFDFQPTIWHSFRQIGNSVSPIVAEKILSVVYHKLT